MIKLIIIGNGSDWDRWDSETEDKILQTKNEMERICKIKHLSYEDKYDLVLKVSEELNEKELRILIKDCRRECANYGKKDEVTNFINSFFSILALLIATAAIYFQQNPMTAEKYDNLIMSIGGIGMLLIFINYILQKIARKRIEKIQYIQDVLEDKYEQKYSERKDGGE